MDLMNNLVFTALNSVGGFPALTPKFFALRSPLVPNLQPVQTQNFFHFDINEIEEFSASDDPEFVEGSIQKHWADMVSKRNYADATNTFSSFAIPPYHL